MLIKINVMMKLRFKFLADILLFLERSEYAFVYLYLKGLQILNLLLPQPHQLIYH